MTEELKPEELKLEEFKPEELKPEELTPYELKRIYIIEKYKDTPCKDYLSGEVKLKYLLSFKKDGLLIAYLFMDFNKLYNISYNLTEKNLFIDDRKIIFFIYVMKYIFERDTEYFIDLMNDLLLILNNDFDYIKILYCMLIEYFIYKRFDHPQYFGNYDRINKAEKINIFINFLYHSKIFTNKIQFFTSKKDKMFFKWYSLQRKNIHHIEYNINFIDLYNLLKKRKFNKELVFEINEQFIDIMEGIIRFEKRKVYLNIISHLSFIKND